MASKTTNYGLNKHSPQDFYNVEARNENWDKIDEALAAADPTKITAKAEPADDDGVMIADSADGGKAKRLLWSSVKETLEQVFGDVRTAISRHIADKSNPHKVTAEQVGAYSKSETIRRYRSVEELGLTTGEETIQSILNNMDDLSELSFSVTDNHADIYALKFGVVTIKKFNYGRAELTQYYAYTADACGGYWGTAGSSDGSTWTFFGWKQIASFDDLSSVASPKDERFIAQVSSPEQLKFPGRWRMDTFTSDINSQLEDTAASMYDYGIGDFHCLLLSNECTAEGCRFGTLLVTSPRIEGRMWLGRIWEYKFVSWTLIAQDTISSTEVTPNVSRLIAWQYS